MTECQVPLQVKEHQILLCSVKCLPSKTCGAQVLNFLKCQVKERRELSSFLLCFFYWECFTFEDTRVYFAVNYLLFL